VFDFATREAADVMIPAPDVAWLDAELACDAALDQVAQRPFSRYPVAAGSLDRVIGVVHVRELAATGRAAPGTAVGALAGPTTIIPKTKDLGALLRELREQRRHMAVVVDEYGGTAGIVTLEDILEEIVGEIQDEYDLPDATLERVDDSTLRVAGSMTIDDFNEATGTDLRSDDARTMAGLVFNALGRRPRRGDEVAVGDAHLRVEELDGPRITRLRVHLESLSG
jgi:putative hemolysin